MNAPPPPSSRWFAALVAAVAVAAVAVLVLTPMWLGRVALVGPTPALFWIMTGCLFLAEVRPPQWLTFAGGPASVSWVFAFALVLMGAPVGALLAIAVASAMSAIVGGSSVGRMAFNTGQVTLSLFTGVVVLEVGGAESSLLPGHAPAGIGWVAVVLVAAATVYGVNAVLVGAAMALRHGNAFGATVAAGLRVNLAGDGVLLALAPVAVVVGQRGLVLLAFTGLAAVGLFLLARTAADREREAHHDPLTELLNRRGFEARCADLADRLGDRRLAIAVIDLDRFKPINDIHGHATGDFVLCVIAERIGGVAPVGSFSARLGGDEFALAWLCGSGAQAQRTARQLVDAIEEPVAGASAEPLSVSASIGVALGGDDWVATMADADAAMYIAKSGRLGVALHPEGVGVTDGAAA